MRIAVDTNVLVRYLTWDDESQAVEAANAIEGADAIVVPTIVLCELVWVLKRAYRFAGPEIVGILRRLVATRASKSSVPPPRPGLRCSRAAATLPTALSATRPTVPNAIASSHSTRALRDFSVPTRLRFWKLGRRREQNLDRGDSALAGLLDHLIGAREEHWRGSSARAQRQP